MERKRKASARTSSARKMEAQWRGRRDAKGSKLEISGTRRKIDRRGEKERKREDGREIERT